MLKNKTALSLSPLALLTLAACGGGGSTTSSTSSSGAVQNGPLEGAFAFLDLHTGTNFQGDGLYDIATEQGMATKGAGDALGAGGYSLTEPASGGYTLIATTNAATVDTDTNTAYGAGVTLKAPEGASVISPQTTLVEAIVAATGVAVTDASITAASTKVATAMGITLPAGETLATFDPYASGVTAATKLAMQKANNNVMTVVKSMASAAEGQGVSPLEANKLAFAGLFEYVDDNSSAPIDFALTATVDLIRADVETAFDAYADSAGGVALGLNTLAAKAEFAAVATNVQAEIQEVATQIAALQTTDTTADRAAIFKVISVLADTVQTYAQDVSNVGIGTAAALTFDTTAQMLNTAPTDIKLSGSTTTDTTYDADSAETVAILESASSLVVGTLTGVDNSVSGTAALPVTADAASALTFAIAGGADSASFNLSGGVLSFNSQPDYESKSSYSVAISATDASGASKVETFTVSITDVAESGGFGITSDIVTFTDYDPATSASINNQIATTTTGTNVTFGDAVAVQLNSENMKYLTDGNALTTGVSPVLSFTLDTVPTGSGAATVTATITDGTFTAGSTIHNGTWSTDGTRSGAEDQISVTVDVQYLGDGTTASLTATAATATGTYNKGDGTSATFNISNMDADSFSITAGNAVTGQPASLDVKMAALYDAFVSGAGNSNMIVDGEYHLSIATTLPLENAANVTVTNFSGTVELAEDTPFATVIGTNGADTLVGTAAAEIFALGFDTDTVTTGGGADMIVLYANEGRSLANIDTITDFSNGTDKFYLDDSITFGELTIAPATDTADTLVSITASGEYLMLISDVPSGFITSGDFISDIA